VSWLPGIRQHREARGRARNAHALRELVLAPPVAEIAACDPRAPARSARRAPRPPRSIASSSRAAVVQVRQVKHARGHRRGRL
jgi:hypothetical protein